MSVMLQFYLVIIYHGIIAPGNDIEVVEGINVIDKRYIYELMYNVQLPQSKAIDSQILIHSSTQNNDFSLAK